MAVYQGTRLRTSALTKAETTPRPRRASAPASVSATPRVRPMGLLMAAIVVVTILGLVYLTPTLGTNATSTEIGRLEAQLLQLDIDITRNEVQALDMTQAEAIIPLAKKQDLKRLRAPVVLTAP